MSCAQYQFGHKVRNRKFAQKLVVLFNRPVGLDFGPLNPQTVCCADEYGEIHWFHQDKLVDGWGEAYDLFKNLTSVQERCTELLMENRELKKQLREREATEDRGPSLRGPQTVGFDNGE